MSHTERSISFTRREFAVPVDAAHGAYHVEISKAWTSASRKYRAEHGLSADHAVPDNAIAFWPHGEEIVISYETPQSPSAVSVDGVARLLAAHDHLAGRISRPYVHLSTAEQQEYTSVARNVLDFASAASPQT